MKVLHILYQSLPQISGSSIRSRDILMSQKEIGINAMAITAPFQVASAKVETIDNVKYYRTKIVEHDTISDKTKPLGERLIRLFGIISFYRHIKKIVVQEKPDVLHAHAMFFCGLPAIFLGKKYNIPVVYEIRSLWMLKKEKKSRNLFSKTIEKLLFKVEHFVIKKADGIVAINENLKNVLVGSGIEASKIKVVNNAVNTTLVRQLKKNNKFERNGLNIRFGYIGTLTPHEGIDLLIKAFIEYNGKNPASKLYIYGKGLDEKYIESLASENENIYFKGGIDPSRVYEAFNNIDIIINPRYKNKLTDSVTPLKPLEAMAYEKLFIGSDVGGIKELVAHGFNGFLFKAGDVGELEKTMGFLATLNSGETSKIKERALEYVITHKSWLKNANLDNKIYLALIR